MIADMRLPSWHRLGHVAADAAVAAVAWWLAFAVRFESIPVWAERLRTETIGWVVLITVIVFVANGLYTRWWRYVSLRDVRLLVRATVIALVAVALYANLFSPLPVAVPRGVLVIWFLLLLIGAVGVRAVARTVLEGRGTLFPRGREVIVVGAGDAGSVIVREMLGNRALRMTPIRLVDDDPRKQGMRLHGVKVDGTTSDLEGILRASPPDEVVIAMPGADGVVRQRVVDACRRAGVPVKTLPGLYDLLDGDPALLRRLREVEVEDILGRQPVNLDLPAIGGYLTGQSVLVTGAGGSIGSELVRQISRLAPARLTLVDHAEDNLFEIDQWLREQGVASVTARIADVKDAEGMRRILAEAAPGVVFHAAAYKHVPLMEANPFSALRNNALATRSLAELAAAQGVERFVLVSTDKAVISETAMGASKALCEYVVEAEAQRFPSTRFIAVRFGNVLASSGSVIPTFRRQILEGGPVTVTDPEMTRFFMTIPEAVQLIVQAGGVGRSGDVFVLDMGEPVRIWDLAHDMVRLMGREPGKDVEIAVIGRRPGEQLHERLFSDDEAVERTHHEKLMRARRGRIDAAWLSDRLDAIEEALAAGRDDEALRLYFDAAQSPRREDAVGPRVAG
jgi:FlaA1/EpsC-like NDP-sugar epimerase